MGPIIGILLVGTLIAIYEVPSLIKNKLIRELWAFSILLFFGLTLSILKSIGVELPNPLDLIENIYQPVSDLIFDVLK